MKFTISGAGIMRRVSVADAERGTGVPARTVRRWAATGRITVVKRGKVWLVSLLEVAELAERRAASAGRLTTGA